MTILHKHAPQICIYLLEWKIYRVSQKKVLFRKIAKPLIKQPFRGIKGKNGGSHMCKYIVDMCQTPGYGIDVLSTPKYPFFDSSNTSKQEFWDTLYDNMIIKTKKLSIINLRILDKCCVAGAGAGAGIANNVTEQVALLKQCCVACVTLIAVTLQFFICRSCYITCLFIYVISQFNSLELSRLCLRVTEGLNVMRPQQRQPTKT